MRSLLSDRGFISSTSKFNFKNKMDQHIWKDPVNNLNVTIFIIIVIGNYIYIIIAIPRCRVLC